MLYRHKVWKFIQRRFKAGPRQGPPATVLGGDFDGLSLTGLSKILIPYGDIERPDKLGNRMLVARLDGHRNFSRINWYA